MHLRSYIVGVKLFDVLLLVACFCVPQTAQAVDEGFDTPIRKIVVDFGPSPYYRPAQHVRNTLTCFHYSTFTVKQYDEGQKGAEWLSIVPSGDAACTRTHKEGEDVPTWGYFWGASGMYAFFSAPDGEDGGLSFAVFDVRTRRKVFEDSSVLDHYLKTLHIENAFRITSRADQVPKLNYLRVVRAECSLRKEQADCWNKVRAEFGIRQTDTPVCSGYEHADWESAVVYPVSVVVTDYPQIKAADGPVFCWPTD
jgi:hypothetical protein